MFTAEFYFSGDKDKFGKPVLFFKLMKPSTADVKAEPFIFDGPAEKHHIEQYQSKYQEFQKSLVVKVEAVEEQQAIEG